MKNDEIFKVIFFLIVGAIWVVIRLLSAVAERQQPPARGAPKPPRPKPLDDEIGEFLRRASRANRSAQPPATGAATGAAPGRPRTARRAEQPVQAETVEETPSGGGVTEHVRKFMDAGEFGRRTSELGTGVAQADEKMDQRLHGVFDHNVGQLSDVYDQAAATVQRPGDMPLATPGGVIALLSRPENVRQAIMISEVLTRPESRWS